MEILNPITWGGERIGDLGSGAVHFHFLRSPKRQCPNANDALKVLPWDIGIVPFG